MRHETNFTASAAFVELSSDAGGSASFDLLGTANDGAYNQYSISGFSAPAGTTALTVRGVMEDGVDALNNPQSLMLDDFDLSIVPEPTSVALFAFGAIGLMLLRRRK